jgi:uncharacterized membrane protein required for colicin V production
MISIIDIIAVLVVGYGCYKGFRAGLIHIIFEVFAVGLSFWFTAHHYQRVGLFLQNTLHIRIGWTKVDTWDNVLVWILTFTLCFILFKIAGSLLTRFFEKTYLGPWNRWAGLGLNASKWLLLMWLLAAILMQLPFKAVRVYTAKSVTFKSCQAASIHLPLKSFLPSKFQHWI